ncbi:uncharacterized protein LOC125326338 isoform X1 [Corvus hawaiiensis]|uniref:uncharacterized protein LOC116444810 isoform X1 n=1 Tax=Corvus moneduloides TaxID=1196302 RepID=UPI001362963A|nr:uncharacterized protein LOC116444810 isoform X1 [Corvus moneduloides]XP_048160464.1 uncharacterized protein LOC125326338 isoform X1 [Corvus hawaiiensis]
MCGEINGCMLHVLSGCVLSSTWSSSAASFSSWTDEFSEQWEQYQELPLLSIVVDDSVALLANDDDEELRDNDGLFGPLTSVLHADCFLWKLEQNQQHPLASRAAYNSVLLLASDDEEEGRNSNSTWSSSAASFSSWTDEFSELLEECEQQRSLSDSSVWSNDDGDEATDSDVSVTDSASEEEDSSEEDTESSDAWPAATIRCPICMDFYPQIMRSGRMVLSTLCGHIFCSQCLPVALQTGSFCPTCREDLTPEEYHPIYI